MSGTAWFKHGLADVDGGDVELDASFKNKLDRIFVSIYDAGHDPDTDTVYVSIKVPLLGSRKIVLQRSKRI